MRPWKHTFFIRICYFISNLVACPSRDSCWSAITQRAWDMAQEVVSFRRMLVTQDIFLKRNYVFYLFVSKIKIIMKSRRFLLLFFYMYSVIYELTSRTLQTSTYRGCEMNREVNHEIFILLLCSLLLTNNLQKSSRYPAKTFLFVLWFWNSHRLNMCLTLALNTISILGNG